MGSVREEMNLLSDLDGSSSGGERHRARPARCCCCITESSTAAQRSWCLSVSVCCVCMQWLAGWALGQPTHHPTPPSARFVPAGDIERYCGELSALLSQKQASLSQLQLRLHAFQ